jgi:hypothetical protein
VAADAKVESPRRETTRQTVRALHNKIVSIESQLLD